ncbi:hypothetical protein Lal_00036960 [Lupinus albus]|nr:hypothetical protein Lal_00036960 [Lupinus albus]
MEDARREISNALQFHNNSSSSPTLRLCVIEKDHASMKVKDILKLMLSYTTIFKHLKDSWCEILLDFQDDQNVKCSIP